MSSRDDMQQRILDLAAEADWDELVQRLELCTYRYLKETGHGEPGQALVHAYAMQAAEVTIQRGADYGQWRAWDTLYQLLSIVVRDLIDRYREKVAAIVRTAEWKIEIPRLIAFTVRLCHGRTSRHGRSAEDYVYGAIEALITHRRYFPYDRVKLFPFLCGVIRSLYTHETERIVAEGAHLSIVSKPSDEISATEWNEDRLVAPPDDDDEAVLWLARDFLRSIKDTRLRRYAMLRAIGAYTTAAEYAKAMGVAESTIRNWDRQLKRRRRRWGATR